jgi:hypothetical protein
MEDVMTKTFIALAAAATIALGATVAPRPASAQCIGCAIGAGIVAGALVGAAATAHANPYYGTGYYAGPAYEYVGPRCFWQRQRVWTGFGWAYDRVRVCY